MNYDDFHRYIQRDEYNRDMDKLDKSIEDINKSFDKAVDNLISSIKYQNDRYDRRMDAIESSINNLKDMIDKMNINQSQNQLDNNRRIINYVITFFVGGGLYGLITIIYHLITTGHP